MLLKNIDTTLPMVNIKKLAVLGPGGNTKDHPTYGDDDDSGMRNT